MMVEEKRYKVNIRQGKLKKNKMLKRKLQKICQREKARKQDSDWKPQMGYQNNKIVINKDLRVNIENV